MLFRKTPEMPSPEAAPAGRDTAINSGTTHYVNGNPLHGPFPKGFETAVFALGCFWGAEKAFWQLPGVFSTAVGYIAGHTKNPSYDEVCSGRTGHTEAVQVVYDPNKISYEELLKSFWENHDPTQGMRQGNDVGTQYRSGIYTLGQSQLKAAEASRQMYQQQLTTSGYGEITSEIHDDDEFFYAEDYHQQYLAKNPNGYCGLGGTGVSCPIGLAATAQDQTVQAS